MLADVNSVLEKVNAGRVAAGLMPLDALPRGVRSSSRDCPLARAFRDLGVNAVNADTVSGLSTEKAFQFASAVGGRVVRHNGDSVVQNPPEFARFVRDFDAGYHSAYAA